MRKWLLVVVVAVAVAFGGWYFASPALALNGLVSAAREGDENELRSRVDFPALRESVSSQLKAKLAAEMSSNSANGFEAFGSMLALNMADTMVESILTPEAISAMALQAKENQVKTARAADRAVEADPQWSVERTGLSRFRVAPDQEGAPSLVFERDGLGWRLSGIDLSEVPFPNS